MPPNIWARLEPEDNCWMWTGATASRDRYGVCNYEGKRWMVHRLVFHKMIRPLLPDEEVHHRRPPCKRGTGLCVKPSHLMAMLEDDHRQLHARPLPSWESQIEIAAEVASRMVRARLLATGSRPGS